MGMGGSMSQTGGALWRGGCRRGGLGVLSSTRLLSLLMHTLWRSLVRTRSLARAWPPRLSSRLEVWGTLSLLCGPTHTWVGGLLLRLHMKAGVVNRVAWLLHLLHHLWTHKPSSLVCIHSHWIR